MEAPDVLQVVDAIAKRPDVVDHLAEAIAKRQRTSWDRWANIVAIMVAATAILWSAAKITGAVERNSVLIDRTVDVVNDIEARVRVVEDRTNRGGG